ncbi:hypothetical protein C8J56DRAFT_3908 [Mycena floridula]|nr:hypothetical protein C8J56DRAFT_3908 [Mycena floridula]
MRLSLLSSLLLIASTVIAAPLVDRTFSSDDTDLQSRDVDDAPPDLHLRDEVALLGIRAMEELVLERRINAAKKAANTATRKANKKDAKAQIKKAGPDPKAKAAKKNDLKSKAQAKHDVKKQAGKDYKNTKGLPKRNSNRPGKPSGKDVRKNRYNSLVNKSGKKPATNQKKIDNKAARGARNQDQKSQIKAAGPNKADKTAKKNELKSNAQDRNKVMKDAGKAYKGTQGLPNRNAKYNIPAGGGKPAHSFTGKDVRQSQFAAHVNNKDKQAKAGGKPQAFGKKFDNKPHQDPGSSGTKKPLDGMTGKGKEHTFSKATDDAGRKADHTNGPARIITQHDRASESVPRLNSTGSALTNMIQ